MTQETEAEIVELAIASCQTCDQLFLISPRRETCPGCGGPPGLVFFEFVGDRAGVHLKDGTLAALAPVPAAVVAVSSPVEPVEAAPVERTPGVEGEAPGSVDILLEGIRGFLGGASELGPDIKQWLVVRLGADPEEAATAIGRLVAVRDLIAGLTPPPSDADLVQEPPEPAQAPEGPQSEPSESS
jgi:hypothetical protein